jgi:hypothetical protein
MISTENQWRAVCYRVEISGWDIDELFFVENAEIGWGEQAEKRVKLRRPLRKGTVVFVRPLLSSGIERDSPTPYLVDPIAVDENGFCEYRLSHIRSRIRQTFRMVN